MTKVLKKVPRILLAGVMAAGMLISAGTLITQTAYAADDDSAAIQFVTNSAAPSIQGAQANSVWFGNYPQSSNEEGGFNVDPIKWRVLANANGGLFLLADQNLDAKQYHDSKVSITWKDCSLRSWLNGTSGDAFYSKAFSSGEKGAIATTTVVNANNPQYDTAGGDDTKDKLFLLSIAEVTDTAYGFSSSYANSPSRRVSSTAYAINNGVGKITNWWWLRSPGEYDYRAVDIRPNAEDTQVFINGDPVDMGNLGPNGVRPAFNLNLGSVLFTSAASGGKACENEGTVNALTAVNTYTGTEWKVTLKDDTRSEFAVDADKVLFNEETGVVTVPYSGAATGTNEYISAIITDKPVTDASAKIKYYGRIAPASSAKGASVTINTAGKMQEGDTLYLFNEQYNGDKKTDCASGLIEIKRAPAVVTTKPTAAATTKPTANSLTYNAKPQKLVTEGEATGGTMQYFVSDSASAAPTSGWSDDIPEQTNTGMYYVWYKAKGDSNHADSEPDYVTAEIGKKKLTITATDQTYVYNGQTQGEGDTAYRDPAQIAEKVKVDGLEGSDALTSIVIDGQGTEIGEYELEVSGAAIGKATGNYDIGYVNGKIIITPIPLNVTVKGSGTNKVYNGKEQTIKGTVTAASSDAGFDASKFKYTGSTVARGTGAGVYTVPLTKDKCSYSDKYYTVKWTMDTPVKLTIKPAKLSITVKGSGGKKTYNGKQQTCEGTVTAVSRDAVFNVSKFSYTGSTVAKGTNVGDYTTPLNKSNCSYKDKNCVVSWTIGAPVKLTIKPARLNITVKGSSVKKTYNGRKQTCKGTVTATSGNTAFDASKFSYSGSTIAEGKEVGDYTTPLLKKKCAYQDRNYVVSWTIGNPIKLSIMPARNDAAVSGTLLVGMTAKGKNGLRFHWTKVTGADGYDVFLARCNHTKSAKDNWTVRTLKGNKTFSWTKTGLKKHTSYKVRVKAWVMKDGKKKYVSASPTAHGYTGGYRDKYTNPKSVSVNKTKVSLKVRKTAIIKARVTKLKKNLKDMPASHAPKLRYITSDSKVATVNGSGKITAKSKGTCKIYVYAVNGAYKTVTVTVR